MTELAKHIHVDKTNYRLYINGQEFPYYISESGVEISGLLSSTETPMVTLSVLAEKVTVSDGDDTTTVP